MDDQKTTDPTDRRKPPPGVLATSARTAVMRGTIEIVDADLDEGEREYLAAAARVRITRRGRGGATTIDSIVDLQRRGHLIQIPRALLGTLRRLGFRPVDRRSFVEADVAMMPAVVLRPTQRAAVEALVAAQQGQAILPCGAGKTIVGCALIAQTRARPLVLVSTVDLALQWADTSRTTLGVEAAVCTGGDFKIADVTIATPQTLAAHLDEARDAFGLLLVDEAHHAAAPTWRRCIDGIAAKYRIGLTATPRSDGLGPLVDHRLGRVVYRATIAETIDAGHLEAPEIRLIASPFVYPYSGPEDWPELLDEVVEDEERNALIADVVARECRGGEVGLVITGRVVHAREIVGLVEARGLRASLLVGEMSKRARAAAIEAAREGSVDVLVGTTIADEGLDIPRLSRAFLVFPAKHEGRIIQRIGRILRPHAGKAPPVVFDFVDERVGVLAHQARRRARIYRETWGARSAAA
jgi:superfamily II DNA or RNA helicase